MEGHAKVLSQNGKRGHYAQCCVSVEESNIFEVDSGNNKDWVAGAKLGIYYACVTYRLSNMKVTINKIRGIDTDTSEQVMAMCSCLALLNALNLDPEKKPYIDDSGNVIFP